MNVFISQMRFIWVPLCMLALLMPLFVSAAPVIRSGDAVTLGDEQNVSGDFYVAGGTASISGSIDGDLYAAAGTVTVNGPVSADAVVAGGTVSIHGPVGDDLRVAGGHVTIAEDVAGDLVVFAGTASVLSTATISGDVLFYGGRLDIAGPVGGAIHARGESIRIDSAIAGNVSVTAIDQLVLGATANIEGDITYKSTKELVRAPDSVVVGETARSDLYASRAHPVQAFPLMQLFMTLFAGLVGLLFFGDRMRYQIAATTKSFGVHGLIGLAALVAMPLTAGILLVSVLGVLLGVFVLLAYFLLLLLSWILAGVLLGTILAQLIVKKQEVTWMWAGIGIIALHVLVVIPFIGPFVAFVSMLIALGGLTTTLYKYLR